MDGEALTAGAVLASARKALRLSVADVARQLKLTPQQVEALEADRYERLPGRVFARGFLRNYAQLVGIDPQPLLRSIERDIPRPDLVELRAPSETVIPHADSARWPFYSALTAFIIVGLLAVYEFGFNEPAHRTLPVPVVAPEGASETGAPASRNVDDEKAVDPAAPSSPVATEAVLAHASAQDAGAGEPRTAKRGSAAERQLDLRFDQDSWVEIRDGNNKVIFSKLTRAGRQEQVTGTPPFRVTVGNARGVRLKYEDKPVDLAPHTGVAVARLTLK
jgi:cytoskeleton protein RodZ